MWKLKIHHLDHALNMNALCCSYCRGLEEEEHKEHESPNDGSLPSRSWLLYVLLVYYLCH